MICDTYGGPFLGRILTFICDKCRENCSCHVSGFNYAFELMEDKGWIVNGDTNACECPACVGEADEPVIVEAGK